MEETQALTDASKKASDKKLEVEREQKADSEAKRELEAKTLDVAKALAKERRDSIQKYERSVSMVQTALEDWAPSLSSPLSVVACREQLRSTRATPLYASDHGFRIGFDIFFRASSSFGKVSAFGSHSSGRPRRRAMSPRWQIDETRWPMSTGK